MTTLRPEGRGFRPSRAGVPVSRPTAPRMTRVPDISSAGMAGSVPGYGTTCRQDVLRGVDVPVMPGAAGRALPRPGLQAQAGEDMPARRARLRRRVPPVDHDQVPPVPGRFVLEHGPEGTPPAVRDRPGQDAAERAVQHAGLRLVGVYPALARRFHERKSYSIKSGYVNLTRREGERRFHPGLSTGVSALRKK